MKLADQKLGGQKLPMQWKVGFLFLVLMNLFAFYTYLALYGEVGAVSRSLGRVEELVRSASEELVRSASGESRQENHPVPDHSSSEEAELAQRRLEEALQEIARLDPSKKHRKEEFQQIWDTFEWSKEDRSGPGSTVSGSADARVAISTVIREYHIRTMLDAPCGTFSWMPLIDFEALNVTYVGVDIVPDNVNNARTKWSTKQPHVFQFYCVDVVDGFEFVDKLMLQSQNQYPGNTHDWSQGWDLIVTREFLQHIPQAAIKRVLRNFNRTKSKYLLITHDGCCDNKDINFGDYHPMNLRRKPFNFPEPLAEFRDNGERLWLYKLPLNLPFLD